MIHSPTKNAVMAAAILLLLMACQPDSHPVPPSLKPPSVPTSPPGPKRQPVNPPAPRTNSPGGGEAASPVVNS